MFLGCFCSSMITQRLNVFSFHKNWEKFCSYFNFSFHMSISGNLVKKTAQYSVKVNTHLCFSSICFPYFSQTDLLVPFSPSVVLIYLHTQVYSVAFCCTPFQHPGPFTSFAKFIGHLFQENALREYLTSVRISGISKHLHDCRFWIYFHLSLILSDLELVTDLLSWKYSLLVCKVKRIIRSSWP